MNSVGADKGREIRVGGGENRMNPLARIVGGEVNLTLGSSSFVVNTGASSPMSGIVVGGLFHGEGCLSFQRLRILGLVFLELNARLEKSLYIGFSSQLFGLYDIEGYIDAT